MAEPATRPRVVVCICTYKRPAVLRDLLARLTGIAADAAASVGVDVGVVVVDDDPAGSARAVAGEAAAAFPLGLAYGCSASGNVAVARNLALELALPRGEWLAMIDDDCVPEDGWLRHLVEAQRRDDADCVSGACDTGFPPNAPRWLRDEPWVHPRSTDPDGAELSMGYLKNTMFRAAFLREHGLRFDERFGFSGGEDAMFFYAAHDAGLRHRHAAHAVVWEQLPPDRVSLGYQLRRRFWYGNTEALTALASGRASSRIRTAAIGVWFAAAGAVRPLRRLARRRAPQWRFAAAEVLRGVGRILGAAGYRLEHR
jgi:succinoglycan biosynthesis protein ExoM